MKREFAWIAIIGVCLVFSGCVTSKVKRGMVDSHTYRSTHNPNIKIEVSNDFKYKADVRGNVKHRFHGKNGVSVSIRHTERMTNKAKIDYYGNPEKWLFSTIPPDEKLEVGTRRILGERWYYCNSIFKTKDGFYCAFLRKFALVTASHDLVEIVSVKVLNGNECQTLRGGKTLSREETDLMNELATELDGYITFSNFEIPGQPPGSEAASTAFSGNEPKNGAVREN